MVIFTGRILLCLSTALITRWLIQHRSVSAIRASAFTTLVIVTVLNILLPVPDTSLAALILGSSFVGMTDTKRLSKRYLAVACLFYSLLFVYLFPLNPGLGGALGLGAFLSCLITYFAKGLNKKRS